jgi:hypothetical protein
MTSRHKESWTEAEWLSFGNQVKQVRADLQSMIMESQKVCRVRELDGLIKVVSQLDKWKSMMENLAAKDVSDGLVTRVFYGEPVRVVAEPMTTSDKLIERLRGYDWIPESAVVNYVRLYVNRNARVAGEWIWEVEGAGRKIGSHCPAGKLLKAYQLVILNDGTVTPIS